MGRRRLWRTCDETARKLLARSAAYLGGTTPLLLVVADVLGFAYKVRCV